MIEPQTWFRKPVPVKVLRVDDQNMKEIARWCGGKIQMAGKRGNNPPARYIKVDVVRPISARLSRAFAGDWVVYMEGSGFKVFMDDAFHKAYDPERAPEETKESALESVKQDVVTVLTEFGNSIHDMTIRLNGKP